MTYTETMPVHNDVYNDQIFTTNWATKPVVCDLLDVAIEQGWQLEDTDHYHYALLHKNQKSLVFRFQHACKVDSDYLVTDSVCSHWKDDRVISFFPHVLHHWSNDLPYETRMPSKLFNCFINRGCPVRQSWLFHLVRERLLDSGFVTAWFEDRFSKTSGPEFFDQCYTQVNKTVFQHEYKEFLSKYTIPFKNFNTNLETAILDSQKSLVLETMFDTDNLALFSEKTWRAAQLPRPFLVFGPAHNIKIMRDLGFDVYDDFIDHSYDTELDWIKRQKMILTELKKPIAYTQSVLDDFSQRAAHNKQVLAQFAHSWQSCYDSILEQVRIL